MITSKLYKLQPYINNSFDETLKVFTDFIMSEFEVTESNFKNSIKIDSTKVGNLYSTMKKTRSYLYNNYFLHKWFLVKFGWT